MSSYFVAEVRRCAQLGAAYRGRTFKRFLAEAVALVRRGRILSLAEVAQSAGVSRATAYRYFPSRSKLVSAVIAEALVALRWHSHGGSAWPNDARA
jgi:hypothetical protein